MAPPDNDVLSARALVKSHNGSPALRGVSLETRKGEILAITGPRGCGKSTLLSCLSGHLLPDRGEVWFGELALHRLPRHAREKLRRERFGWIGTEPGLLPELTARENAALPLLLDGASYTAATTTAQEWLERLDIASCADSHPDELPEARRQRVAIARALTTGPAVLFADEPTAPLHSADQGQILRTLTAACRSHGITIVLATSRPDVAAYADRTIAMADGCREDEQGEQGEQSARTGGLADNTVDGPAAVPDTAAGGTAVAASGLTEPSGVEGADRCSVFA